MALANTATQIHLPERSHVEVSDATEIPDFLERTYESKLRVSRIDNRRGGGSPLVHVRIDVGPFAIDEVEVAIDFEASPDPLNKVVGIWATRGTVACDGDGIKGRASPGQITLLSQPHLPFNAEVRQLHETVVLMEPRVVAGVAAGLPATQATLPIRFSSLAPVNARAAQRWKDTVSYVKDAVLTDHAISAPLVLGPASRLLAAVTLSTFPNTAIADPTPHDRNDHQPVLLRRAIEFIEANVTSDIGVADIAEAVHVTPRAVQYMFRRHLDTTPLQYLRRLRLHYAHQDLLAAEGNQDSVTAIAARRGFAHTGRFALLYRQTYGHSPHTTLRRRTANRRTPPRGESDELMVLLLRTLWTYRGLRGDLTRTAAALAVYPSTVRYRLYRIRELTGLDPEHAGSAQALRDITTPNPHH